MKEENLIQKILRNEITWTIFILGLLWGCVTTIVIPLKTLQLQIAQIQSDISKQNSRYDMLESDYNSINGRVGIIESRLNNNK